MLNEQCLRDLIRILEILEVFELPDHEIWEFIIVCLNGVINGLEADLNAEEDEQEMEA